MAESVSPLKKIHAEQFLKFSSHRPLHQKLVVSKTLLDAAASYESRRTDIRRAEEGRHMIQFQIKATDDSRNIE